MSTITTTPVQDLGVTHPRPGTAIRVFIDYATATNVAITYAVQYLPAGDGYDWDVLETVETLAPHVHTKTKRHPFDFAFDTFHDAANAATNAARNLTPEHFGVTVATP